MVSSFFLSLAYVWNIYYLVGYAVCFRRIYESQTGQPVVIEKRKREPKTMVAPAISETPRPASI